MLLPGMWKTSGSYYPNHHLNIIHVLPCGSPHHHLRCILCSHISWAQTNSPIIYLAGRSAKQSLHTGRIFQGVERSHDTLRKKREREISRECVESVSLWVETVYGALMMPHVGTSVCCADWEEVSGIRHLISSHYLKTCCTLFLYTCEWVFSIGERLGGGSPFQKLVDFITHSTNQPEWERWTPHWYWLCPARWEVADIFQCHLSTLTSLPLPSRCQQDGVMFSTMANISVFWNHNHTHLILFFTKIHSDAACGTE